MLKVSPFEGPKIKVACYKSLQACHKIAGIKRPQAVENIDSETKKHILKGSDDGVYHLKLLGFWTSSIIQYSKN
jgi:hypothetical protein